MEWFAYLYLLVHVIVALGCGVISGILLRWILLIRQKAATRKTLLGGRLAGGLVGFILAYFFIGYPGSGPGMSGGAAGLEQEEVTQPIAKQKDEPPTKTVASVTDEIEEKTAVEPMVVRIRLLGGGTEPPFERPDKFFTFVGSESPRAVNAETVGQELAAIKETTPVREVELQVSLESTSLRNLEVQRLRKIIEDSGTRFYAPDPNNPLEEMER